MNLLEKLNAAQREAVEATEGPVLIIAGAGSGKTRALTFRVAYLIQKGVNPRHILAVTFTNKAAQEMKERIRNLVVDANLQMKCESTNATNKLPMPNVGTFHSICVRILRQDIEKMGYNKDFNIFDTQDQLMLMKKTLKELQIDPERFKPKSVLGTISKAKNELISEKEFSEQVGSLYEEMIAKVYGVYQKKLRDNNALDFDDILMATVKLFQKFPEVLLKYQNFFRYIMVDEYQDTNHAQYILVKLLSGKFRNLCVVGDDWQCLPKGTKISVDGNKRKPIEKIERNETVFSASGQGDVCEQQVNGKKTFPYKGTLFEITTESGKKIQATPNHIMFSRLSFNRGIFYVYLMYKKNVGYRIGMAKGVRIAKSGLTGIGLNVRANQERADKMWILKVCKNKSDAQYWEQYLGFFYGIPTLVFLTGNRNMKLSQKQIDDFFIAIDTSERVKKIFQDFCLNFDYPHHLPQATIRNGIKRVAIHFTMFGDCRKGLLRNWGMHRISVNSNDKNTKKILETNGFKTRKGKFQDWRLEIARKDYGEAEMIFEKLISILPDAATSKRAILAGEKRFSFFPASHIKETMVVPVFKKGKIVEEEVKKVEKINYSGSVYDLNISNLHNYIANDFVVHNSIYSFRGANIRNILDFEKDYPDAKVVKLEQNYRSTQNILDAAHGVISKNVNRKDKKIWTDTPGGHPIFSYSAEDEQDEAHFIAGEIKKKIREGEKPSDFVVLYRTNAQSRAIEEAMLRNSIPYKIIGGLKFYQRKEIKDIIAYLRVISNFSDVVSLERIINEPKRNIGEKTLNSWLELAKSNKQNPINFGINFQFPISNFQSISNDQISNDQKIQNTKYKIQDTRMDAIAKFCEFVSRMNEKKDRLALTDFIQKVFAESGYEKSLTDGSEEGEARLENVRELLTVAKKYDSDLENGLKLFLEEVALSSDTDQIEQEKDYVHLMTLHSAKGLEFKTVFIAGLEEGLFPHSRSLFNNEEMEEERRLMYVGVTRAKEKVFLIYSETRNIFGSVQVNAPSRFLDDIPENLRKEIEKESSKSGILNSFRNSKLETRNSKQYQNCKPENYKIDSEEKLEASAKGGFVSGERSYKLQASFKDGDMVVHEMFGEGRIVGSQGDTITIAFYKVGLKKLSASIAPIKKI